MVGVRQALQARDRRAGGMGVRRGGAGRAGAGALGGTGVLQAGVGYGRARPGRAVGPVGCALGALSLFLARFDSILFLSRFFDIVRAPGS